MARLPGDPSSAGKLAYTLGHRLAPEHRGWVRHDLTDADWRWRLAGRHALVLLPVCLAIALLLPGPVAVRVLTPLLVWLGSVFIVAIHADAIRDRKLRQHGLDPPNSPSRTDPSPPSK